ncbi:hypothetical protein LLE87_27385, partial [Paenibacillus polymyxa]|nr:hypothetical protein [Paenibacillus polymyxa]
MIENTRLQEVVVTGKPQIGEAHEAKGVTRIVSRIPIFDRDKKLVAAIGQVMFKSPDALQKMSAEISRLRKEVNFYRRELSSMDRPMAPTTRRWRSKIGVRLTTRVVPCISWVWPISALPLRSTVSSRVFSMTSRAGRP